MKKRDPQGLVKLFQRCTATSGNDPLPSHDKAEYRRVMQSRYELCGSPCPRVQANGEVDWNRHGWFRLLGEEKTPATPQPKRQKTDKEAPGEAGEDGENGAKDVDDDMYGNDPPARFTRVQCSVFQTVVGPGARFGRNLPLHSFGDFVFRFCCPASGVLWSPVL